MLHQVEIYAGAFVLALIIMYETKNYWIVLLGGLIVFSVFYFSFGFDDKNFQFTFFSTLKLAGHVVVLYMIPCSAAMVLFTATNRMSKNAV